MIWRSLLRLVKTYRYAPWFTAAVLAVLVVFLLLPRACGGRPGPVGKIITAEPLNYYDPDFLYEIPIKQTWVQTGEVAGVPTIEPGNEKTRKLVEAAFGEEADDVDFLFVGEVGRIKHGADLAFVQDREPDRSVEIGELPRGVNREGVEFPVGPPPRLILRPREAPRFWIEKEHAVEVGAGWDTRFVGQIELAVRYRPGRLWVKDWFYLTGEVETGLRDGEVDARGHVWLGTTLAGESD